MSYGQYISNLILKLEQGNHEVEVTFGHTEPWRRVVMHNEHMMELEHPETPFQRGRHEIVNLAHVYSLEVRRKCRT